MAPLDLETLLAEDKSLLTKKYGKEVVNYFGGSNLNRFSFLRTDHPFLSKAFSHEDTLFLVLNDLAPLIRSPSQLHTVSASYIIPLTGSEPFKKSEEEMIRDYDSEQTMPLIIFLGIREGDDASFQHGRYRGRPFFAVDVTPRGSYADVANTVIEKLTADGSVFKQTVRNITLSSTEGTPHPSFRYVNCQHCASWMLWASSLCHGLEPSESLLCGMWKAHLVHQRGVQAYLPTNRSTRNRYSQGATSMSYAQGYL